MGAPFMIAVLTHGFVLVGDVEDFNEEKLVFRRAATLRRWGTKRGLGDLAKGPARETVCDPMPTRVEINRAHLIYTMECDRAAWETAVRG